MSDLGPGKLVRGEYARVWDYTSDAHSWHQWAEHTYRAADVLFNHGDPFLWFGAAVLGHQSVEMFLKAILIGKGRRVIKGDVWGHDLLDLMKQVKQSGISLPPEFEEDFRVFNSFFNELRYPSALKEVSGLGEEEAWRLERIVLVLRPLAEAAYGQPSAGQGESGE